MFDTQPKIYTPHLSHSEPGDKAAFGVENLQAKLISELRVSNFHEHPNVDNELMKILDDFSRTKGEFTMIDRESNDGEALFMSKPLSEKAHIVMRVGKAVELDNGEVARELDNLFILDKESGNIADLKEIWEGNPLFQGDISPLVISGTRVSRGQSGAQLIKTWQPIITLPYLLGNSGMAYFDLSRGMKALAAPHELGHLLQMNEEPRRLYAKSIKEANEGSSNLTWLKIASHLPLIGKKVVESKNEWVKMERNAHAFALNLFRKLNQSGIDLKQVLPEMVNAASEALSSHDIVLRSIRGNSFSRGHKSS